MFTNIVCVNLLLLFCLFYLNVNDQNVNSSLHFASNELEILFWFFFKNVLKGYIFQAHFFPQLFSHSFIDIIYWIVDYYIKY